MNENIDLTKILKNCPRGTKLYSTVYGEVEFVNAEGLNSYPICIITQGKYEYLTKEGKLFSNFDGECTLFPSREERNWYNFKPKKPKFDPKTLKAFDKVLVRNCNVESWRSQIFSHILEGGVQYPYLCINNPYKYCIPYNDDTKHLVGTTDEAPEFYRYWEY